VTAQGVQGGALNDTEPTILAFYFGAGDPGMANPMIGAGDMVMGGPLGEPTRLGAGAAGQTLAMSGGLPTWTSGLTNPMTQIGDLIVGGAARAATRLAIGAHDTGLRGAGGS